MAQLSLQHYLRNLKLIERNREWLLSNRVSVKDKVVYYIHIISSYMGGKKRIKYLGSELHYDNPATPLNLQNYPHEITKKILENMECDPASILDIGGNIGQFSLTFNYVLKGKAKIDIFEPNKFVFKMLEKNINTHDNIRAYNFGLGDRNQSLEFYYNPLRTGVGSPIRENAGEGKVVKENIDIVADVKAVTKRKSYDLIKIDVEGYEFHVLSSLKNVTANYLFIEVSGSGRQKDYTHYDMLQKINSVFGDYDIFYIGEYSGNSPTFDMLLKFKNSKSK